MRGLGREGAFEDVTFDVRRGEVLCMAGLIGARRTDVALALFGIAAGDVRHDRAGRARRSASRSPREAMALGIAYVSEDRRKLGLRHAAVDPANITLATLRTLSRRASGLVAHAPSERRPPRPIRKRLNIRTPTVELAGRQAVGRQPAEGHAGQVAEDAARRC